jgi:general secretion pathway protein L
LLPKATTVIAALADTDVSWHRITLPKAPASRLRAALGGVLEEALLEDADDVHLALAPSAAAGQPTWVAAVSRRWLRGELAALEKAEVFVDRVVPMAWPDDPPIGHFAETEAEPGGPAAGVALHWAHPDGVASVRLQGGLARALVPQPAPPETRWSATPGAVAAAEQWLGGPVRVMAPGQRLLQAARSLWNLRQFELARRNRGARALRDSARKFFSIEWRPVRIGLVGLVIAQVLGLNLWAWNQRSAIESKQVAMQNLVKAAYPNVSAQDVQRDADAVMQRETQALRTLAGKPGDTDLETMLQAAASAWPADRPPVESLRFEPGKLTLSALGWSDAQVSDFRSLLAPAGWTVESIQGKLTLSRARPGARS